ncbi:MAG: hypothetical protein N4A33_07130 [Bacteriovoracaceae bacterium]|nr:hypothetical protein [Bacteriovoracaceae bacterium]
MSKSINNLLIPNVTRTPSDKKVDSSNALQNKGANTEFSELLKAKSNPAVNEGVSLTSHAAKRLEERNIDFDGKEYMKIKEAISKLQQKGSKDSLVITDKAAYVIDVNKEKIVTAVDKMSMNENVFTKIDSTVFMN